MDLSDILSNVADQDRGIEFDLLDPVDGTKTGIKFRVAGPDSETQHRARIALADELADVADNDGRVSAAHREMARLNCLARCVLGWTMTDFDKPVPFNTANVLRALRVQWVQQQVDGFASDRAAFRGGA